MEQTIEGNKLMVEFIGLRRGWWIHQEKPLTEDKKQWCDLDGKTFLGSRVYYDKDLKFHTSRDWLMPVWKKCHEIGLWMMTNGHDKLWLEKSKEIENAIVNEVNCEKAAMKISQLIKWYNENKK